MQKNPISSQKIGLLSLVLLIIAGLVYSLLFPINRMAVDHGVPPLGYVTWISLGGGMMMVFICIITKNIPKLSRRHLITYFVGGALSIAAPMSLLVFAAPRLPSTIITMIVVLSPLLSYLFALPTKLDKFRWLGMGGLLCGMGGVLLLLIPDASLPQAGMVGWVLLTLLAPIFLALFNIFIDLYAPPKEHSLALSTGILFASGILMAPIALATGDFLWFTSSNIDGDLTTIYATLINVARWWLIFIIIRMTGAVFVSQIAYVIVIAGFGWEALFFEQSGNNYIWGAAGLLLLGLFINTYSKFQNAKKSIK